MIRKQNELVCFLKSSNQSGLVSEAIDEDLCEDYQELMETEEEIAEVKESEILVESENEVIANETILQSEIEEDSTYEEIVVQESEDEVSCAGKSSQKVERLEEVKYEELKPQLVLTPNFLKAREALKKLSSQAHAESTATDYVTATLISNSNEKLVFICNDSKCKAVFSSEDEVKLHLGDHRKFESEPLQCEFCPQLFKTRHFYDKHVESVHNGSQFICQVCGRTLETRIQWRSHLRNHDNTLKYKCSIEGCPKAFRVKHHLDNHLRSHTKESPFECTFAGCSARFRQKHALTIHLRKHTGEFFNCEHCKSPFVTQFQLGKHLEKCNGTYKPLVTRATPRVKQTESSDFKCAVGECGESFKAKVTLEKHLSKVHAIQVTQTLCVLCCSNFETQQALKSHLREHLPFSCPLCSVNFKNEENLQNHMAKSHDKEEVRLHRCHQCSACFKRAEHLRTHVAYKHNKDRPYACDSCSYVSPTRQDLNSHMRTHIKDFPCRFCDFSGNKLASLKVHVKSAHNTEEYYFCDSCSQGFKYQTDFNSHQKTCLK